MKNLICYLSIICMLIPACTNKPSSCIPQEAEGSDSVVSKSMEFIEEKEPVSPRKANVSVRRNELAHDYGWIAYIDGTYNPNDSCYKDFKLYIEDFHTQEQRIIMECRNGKAYLPIKGDRSYKTFEQVKKVLLLSSNRMFILEDEIWKHAAIIDIESLSVIKEFSSFDMFTGYKWDGLEFKIFDDVTLDNRRIFTRRYNTEGEMVYEEETIIKYDNPNPVIPKETNKLSNKIKEYTSNLPIDAKKIADGYDWIVYRQEMPDVAGEDDWCDAVKLYIENKNSHKLYFLLQSSCGNQKGTELAVLNQETNKYEYQSEFFVGYWGAVEVLSPTKLLLGMSDERNLYDYVIDLETFSAIFIDYGIEVVQENGRTYLIHSSCDQQLGTYRFWTSRYDIYGNLLHKEVTTILYPHDYQIEGDCW